MKTPKNKRSKTRRARHHEAWVFTDAGSRHCTVVNISGDGATLSVKDEMPLPRKFELAFSLNRVGAKNCELVWNRGATAGVKFVP
jgi:PilZ domain-containing protein